MVKPVAAGADGCQIIVMAALQKITRVRHAILNGNVLVFASASHVVEKRLACVNVAAECRRIGVNAIQPVLFIGECYLALNTNKYW